MNKVFKQIVFLIVLVSILVIPYFVFADNSVLDKLNTVGKTGGYNDQTNEYTLSLVAGTAIGGVLSILGIVFIALMIYGGFNWMMASGDEEKLNRAKNTLRRAIIGIVITVGSYAIWKFVAERLIGYTG